MTLREFFDANSDKLGATIILAVTVAATVGFRRRSTGMANWISCVSAATLAVVAYPVSQAYGYGWEVSIATIGLGSGTCAYALFGVLMRIADKLEARGGQLADQLIDRAIPPHGGKHGPGE